VKEQKDTMRNNSSVARSESSDGLRRTRNNFWTNSSFQTCRSSWRRGKPQGNKERKLSSFSGSNATAKEKVQKTPLFYGQRCPILRQTSCKGIKTLLDAPKFNLGRPRAFSYFNEGFKTAWLSHSRHF